MALPIRARLTLVSGVLMAALLLAVGAFVYLRFRADLLEAVDAGLRSRAELLRERSATDPLPQGGGLAEPDDAFAQVLSSDARVLASSPGLGSGALLPPGSISGLEAPRFFDVEVRTAEEPVQARLLAAPAGDDLVVVVGASLDDQQEALARLLALLGLGGPVAVALASGVGWVVAGAALRPVERMRSEAEAVSASEPGRRLPVPRTGDELVRLGETLNVMLGRLEAAVERERRFVGDAGHELRTPLANLKAELELALRRSRTSEELVGSLRSAAEETDRLSRLAEDLLVLARAEGGRLPVRREELDLAALVRAAMDASSGRASDRGVSLEARLQGGLAARVDPQRIRQAVENLLDNALRHTPRDGRVTVELVSEDGDLSITVEDTGNGFPASFLPEAFEPFARADPSRARGDGGAGLGLAIVRAVAEAHGGSVEARNRPEGGAIVILRIPA
jgi:two-component system OmpR family sensor kinase